MSTPTPISSLISYPWSNALLLVIGLLHGLQPVDFFQFVTLESPLPSKVNLSEIVQKFNFDKTLQFFLGNQSCQQLKSANPPHFHEFFTPNFFDNFSREIKFVNRQKIQNRNIFTSFSPKKSIIFTRNES